MIETEDTIQLKEEASRALATNCILRSGFRDQVAHGSPYLRSCPPVLFEVRADDEPVDPKKYLEDGCKPKCVKQLRSYEACVKRIQGDESGHKHCTGQYFDYWSCVDKCVAPTLFPKLK
ncbi:hypothetical protein V6N12_023095 [Hibiscus sabdariffa]|uniref:Ubiquinol-cytochrome C reductase hinge domain-containing protein n=1 Tax=Hibiscus sabdariffa TaxID=183260 RepID=A0ABR2FWP7_9ROSI